MFSGRNDKVEGDGQPLHEWKWMDRVKNAMDKSDIERRVFAFPKATPVRNDKVEGGGTYAPS